MREELCLKVKIADGIQSARARVRAVNGKELPNWQAGPRFPDYLRQLVTQGWTISRVVDSATLLFER